MKRAICCLFVIVALAGDSAWGLDPINPQITQVAEQWLQLLDSGEYERAWEATARAYKEIIGRDHFDRVAVGQRKLLGKALKRNLWSEMSTTSLDGMPTGQYYFLRYGTEFENKRSEAFEYVWLAWEGEAWRVTGYRLR